MPRAPSALALLLLMAAVALAAAAADAQLEIAPPCRHRRRVDHVDAAAAATVACPPPCPATAAAVTAATTTTTTAANKINNNSTNTQCLHYLQESHKEEVCGPDLGPERRRALLRGLRMRHCCEHAVDGALPEIAFRGGDACRRMLDDLLVTDELADRISCEHSRVLDRYDCGQVYSIAHRCHHCEQAYRRWVCSSLVPHFTRAGERLRPCLSVCQDVEQQCPYLLPGDWTNQTVPPSETAHPTPQYAGEPTFLCLDPNIPETGLQKLKSSRGDEDCCYTHCGAPGRRGGGPAHRRVCEHCPGRPAAAAAVAAPARTLKAPHTVLLLLLLVVCASRTTTRTSAWWRR